ncbi:carbamoyl-phosphate-synthetase [uncultured Winogradskyella sp.]|uniref:ATP-grasp domain-containing protein n=1 Tax=uncultured Winogradskyella sp. TaxID=395353 RepID=UPI0026148A86|nr:carbamoyl-phosphate-synthetase [uncultured Winogradskyella sp.]
MKKIIILGGNPETAVVVDVANSMGLHTIAIDMGINSPAKQKAKESYDIDVFEVEKVAQIAKDNNVDAVLVGVADILVKPYKDICDILNIPCYATTEAVEAFCSKDGFKKYCLDFDIQDIPGIYIEGVENIDKPHNLGYPVMIKPVDNGGGVGMKICRDEQDYKDSARTAFGFSKKGVILVERYMDCDDMAAYYTFKDGVAHISAISDRITTKIQGDASPVCIGAVYPSKHSALFIEQMHPKLCKLFKALKIENGILNIQFFVEDGIVYAYDPGFRLQGEAPHFHLLNIHGFDHRKMLLNFALTGVFGDNDFETINDYTFNGKKACTVWVLLKGGKIDSIKGLDTIKADDNIHFVLERFKEGDTVQEDFLGTERQVYARIYLVVDSITEVNQKIEKIKNTLKVTDTNGNNMILEWLKPFKEDDYR